MIYKNMLIHNCDTIVKDEFTGEEKLIRIPDKLRKALSPIGLKYSGYNTPGIEIRFRLLSEKAKLHIKIIYQEGAVRDKKIFAVFHGSFQGASHVVLDEQESLIRVERPENLPVLKEITERENLPFSPEVVRIIAPGDCHFMILKVEGEVEPPERKDMPKLTWLAYGSSITQGGSSISPIEAYASLTARKLKTDLINMGFGGSALLEPEMADYLAERKDWDFATLEMGINMTWDIEHGCMGDPEFFRSRVDYFIPRIAGAHPDKWIFCMDIFTTKDDYTGGEQAEIYRRIVREKVESLKLPKLRYLNGPGLLHGADSLTVDLIHPSDYGMMELSEALAAELRRALS